MRLWVKYEFVDLFAGRSVKPTSAICKTASLGFKNVGFERDSANDSKDSPNVCAKIDQGAKDFTDIPSKFEHTLKTINHQRKEDKDNNNKKCSPTGCYPDVLADTVKKDKDKNKDKVEDENNTFWKQTKETFKNKFFMLLLLNGAMFLFGSSIVFTHIIAYAESQGISATLAKVMVTLLGVASLLGKIGLGFVSQKDGVNTILLYSATIGISGKF